MTNQGSAARPVAPFANCFRMAGLLCLLAPMSFSAAIFSSTFSDPGNAGSIGGGLFSGSATNQNIGQGPWQGSYQGIAGLLVAPSVSVSTTGGFTGGSGTIAGIVGVDILNVGLTNNGGWLSQDIGMLYQADTIYTLTANVNTGGLISDIGVLSNGGVGIGLTQNGSLFAASTDPGAILHFQLLGGTTYQITLQTTIGNVAPSGNIGIRLFDQPLGLATANLFAGVTFSNVQLDASSPVPEPSSVVLVSGGVGLMALAALRARRRKLNA